MVPSETKQPESLRDARDLWSVVTTTFYYFPSGAVSRAHARSEGGRESGSEAGRAMEEDDKRETPGGYSTSPDRKSVV